MEEKLKTPYVTEYELQLAEQNIRDGFCRADNGNLATNRIKYGMLWLGYECRNIYGWGPVRKCGTAVTMEQLQELRNTSLADEEQERLLFMRVSRTKILPNHVLMYQESQSQRVELEEASELFGMGTDSPTETKGFII